MTAAAPAQTPQVPLQRRLALRANPLACALAVVAVLTAVRLTGTVDSDVAWQLWIAQRLHAGAQLYRDIIEVNPPLWFWMAIPMERLSTLLHVQIESVAIASISLFAALSLAATNRLIGHIESGRRAAFLAYAALVLVAVPWMHTGQREQIALIAALPYVVLISARVREERLPTWLAAAVGVGAGLGFGLKHYFLIVPVLLELWLISVQHRRWRALRPETLALASTGIAYAAAILLLAPEYLRTVVPFVQLLYGAFSAPSWAAMLGPFALVTAILLGALGAHWRLLASKDTAVAAGLFVAALGFAAAYLIQFKGWPYHTLSALGCAAMGIAALLAEATRGARLFRIVGPSLLVLPLVLAAKEQMNEPLPSADLIGAVAGVHRGATVGFLGTEAAVPWSVTLQHGYRYPSRYISHWMVIAVERNRRRGLPDPRIESAWRNVVRQTVHDFRCTPPARIIVARPAPGDSASFDILPMFSRDPAFAALLAHYRPISRTSFEAFELVRPLPPLPSSQCRPGV